MTCLGRRLARTKSGLLCLLPESSQVGDMACFVRGGRILFELRRGSKEDRGVLYPRLHGRRNLHTKPSSAKDLLGITWILAFVALIVALWSALSYVALTIQEGLSVGNKFGTCLRFRIDKPRPAHRVGDIVLLVMRTCLSNQFFKFASSYLISVEEDGVVHEIRIYLVFTFWQRAQRSQNPSRTPIPVIFGDLIWPNAIFRGPSKRLDPHVDLCRPSREDYSGEGYEGCAQKSWYTLVIGHRNIFGHRSGISKHCRYYFAITPLYSFIIVLFLNSYLFKLCLFSS